MTYAYYSYAMLCTCSWLSRWPEPGQCLLTRPVDPSDSQVGDYWLLENAVLISPEFQLLPSRYPRMLSQRARAKAAKAAKAKHLRPRLRVYYWFIMTYHTSGNVGVYESNCHHVRRPSQKPPEHLPRRQCRRLLPPAVAWVHCWKGSRRLGRRVLHSNLRSDLFAVSAEVHVWHCLTPYIAWSFNATSFSILLHPLAPISDPKRCSKERSRGIKGHPGTHHFHWQHSSIKVA